MKKIVTIIGARPQFVKSAVISRAINLSTEVEEVIIHTGQHFDMNMSDIFFEEMKIPEPSYYLNINNLSHGAMTGQMIEKIEQILIKEQPDWVLVYGDTNSTIAGALAAKKMHIKLAHVEAGLRSYNMYMPEEINRILTDRISDILFCPTETAVNNLRNEGYNNFKCEIIKSGDVMQDAALFYSERASKPSYSMPSKFILSTLHRAENTDDSFKLNDIIDALNEISQEYKVVMPLHPRTRNKLTDFDYDFKNSNIIFINPVSYLEMVWLLKNCSLVMTDSGGLQKEAYFFEKYCITLREETEWIELVDNGFNILVGSNKKNILEVFKQHLLIFHESFDKKLYGDGNAADLILKSLLSK